jgi:ABC-type Fe3+-hydroxamate transport system substrate-binding protein
MRFLLLLALLAAGHGAAARSVVDAGGRSVAVPDHVARVFAAGPPASATIYVVAPDRLVGWIRPPSDAARDDQKDYGGERAPIVASSIVRGGASRRSRDRPGDR